MDTEQSGVDVRSYLKILSRRRWLMLATVLAVVASTALVSWRLRPIYEGVARVEVQPTSSSSGEASRVLESLVDPTRGLQTQVELVRSQAVLRLAAKELGLPSTDDLQKSLAATLLQDTQIVEIRVEHERPEEASDWANAVANAYITFRRERALETSLSASEAIARDIESVKSRITEMDLKAQQDPQAAALLKSERDRSVAQLNALEAQLQVLPDAEAVQRGGGTIISAAETPTVPVRPRKMLNLAIAMVVGVLLALGMAFLAENLDDRMKNPEEVEAHVGAPILGYIPLVKEWEGANHSRLAIQSETASGAAEAYRTLRTNLRFVSLERPLKTLLVTSAVAEAGKTTSAANLAATLAEGGAKVVLVSADLRRPTLHKLFGLTNSRGLVDALNPDFPLELALQNGVPNLRVLSAGGLPPNPTEILGSARFDQLLSELQSFTDLVVIDAPPVLGLGDSSALASKVDGILFVVRTAGVSKREVSHASDQLRKAGGKVIGCLLNAVETEQDYGYYYHYYYSRYQEDGSETSSPSGVAASEGVSKTSVTLQGQNFEWNPLSKETVSLASNPSPSDNGTSQRRSRGLGRRSGKSEDI